MSEDWAKDDLPEFDWEEHEDFEVEDLGIMEEWVYDIEVEENHNFFANDILVHNSNYYQLEPIFDRFTDKETYRYILSRFSKKDLLKFKKQSATTMDLVQLAFVLYHDEHIVGPVIDKFLRDFEEKHNTTRYLKWDFEGESEIKTQAVWKKKRYIYEQFDGKITVKGLDVIKTNTSHFIRGDIKKLLIDLVKNVSLISKGDNNIYYEDEVKRLLKKYKEEDVFQISNPCGIGAIQWDKWIVNDTPIKGANKNIKSLYYFNKMLDNMGERYDNVDRVHEGKIHVFEVYKSNKFGITTIGIPFSINESIGKRVLDNFQLNFKKQWSSKGENILQSVYEVFDFEPDKKQTAIVNNSIFL